MPECLHCGISRKIVARAASGFKYLYLSQIGELETCRRARSSRHRSVSGDLDAWSDGQCGWDTLDPLFWPSPFCVTPLSSHPQIHAPRPVNLPCDHGRSSWAWAAALLVESGTARSLERGGGSADVRNPRAVFQYMCWFNTKGLCALKSLNR